MSLFKRLGAKCFKHSRNWLDYVSYIQHHTASIACYDFCSVYSPSRTITVVCRVTDMSQVLDHSNLCSPLVYCSSNRSFFGSPRYSSLLLTLRFVCISPVPPKSRIKHLSDIETEKQCYGDPLGEHVEYVKCGFRSRCIERRRYQGCERGSLIMHDSQSIDSNHGLIIELCVIDIGCIGKIGSVP